MGTTLRPPDGAVTLSGEVGSYPEELQAAKSAHHVHGVATLARTVRSWTGHRQVEDASWSAPGVAVVSDQLHGIG